MPPRRSSRSTRASAEPAAATTQPGKRKRGQVADPEPQEQEEVAKPPSRTRRSTSVRSSVAPTNGRTSSRSRGSLPDVPETEDEEEAESAPPVKKARPSIEPKEEEDSEFEEEKAKPRRSSSAAKRGKPASAGRKPASTSTRSARSTRAAPAPAVEEDEGEEPGVQVPEEDVKPPRVNGRKTSKSHTSTSNGRTSVDDSDTAMNVSDEEPKAKPRKGKPALKAAAINKVAKRRKPASRSVTIPDSDEGSEGEQQTQSSAKDDTSAPATSLEQEEAPVEEEEDEKSLFDPPPMPAPSSLPQTVPEEPSGPKPRLVIHKMALVNFKSYAGRQEIGPFHKSFSSIVGPNGSGKSNTIDALLFVFGYRASKMRQGKLSELIHNSARYPDLDECSVEVHFRDIIDLPGPDAFEVVPRSQLIVTRTAFKNNSSRYTINGKSSTYTEVQTLLKGRGIDLDHNRFLILQGEVESIALMKPKATTEHEDGLLEYLEDIIGTSRFKEPIDEALVEMERLQEDRMVKLNRLRIVEKEKAALEQQKKEAEDYLRLKNEKVRAQSRLFQWILWKCFQNETEFEKTIAKLKKDLEEETNRNKDDILHLEQLRAHYQAREATYAEVKAAATEALKELATHEKEEVELQERRKHAAAKAKKLKKSLQDDTSARTKALRDIEDNTEKIEREKKKADKFEAELVVEEKELEKIRDSLKDKTQVFHDQIELKQKELQPWTAKINAKQAEVDVASSERDALAKKAETREAARKDAQDTLEGLNSDHAVKVKEHEKLQETKANLQRQTQAAERKVQDCQKNVQEWRAKASSSRQKVDEAKASQADNRSQGRVLDSLTRLQATGRIAGFHGRLGSLGTIPDKYDIAVSTAAPALYHLVVDKVEQGQQCIEYLRTQNVGRASFMVLEKLTHSSGMAKIATPENVPRLFDLIKPKDPKFAPAFYKAVGNTLVAENMEQANRIAFGAKRWKVVTLTGQLIETSGTMSGGGSQPARGAMSSKLASDAVSPQVLKSYEQESQQAAERLEQALQELKAAEDELERLRNSGPQIDIAFQKLGLDIENSRRRIADAEKRVQEVNAQNKPNKGDLARISTLDGEIAASTAELEQLQSKTRKIEEAIQELEKKILDIGGSRLLKQKSTVDGIKLHITLANEEITKAEVAKAKAEKDSTKFDSAIKTNTAALEEAETELADLDAHLGELTAYVTKLRSKVEDAQEAAENSKDDLDRRKLELDAKDQEIEQFRQKEMEIKQVLSDTQKEAAENEKLIDYWRAEHDELQLEEIDDDDDDDEDEEGEASGGAKPNGQPEAEGEGDPGVKPDPDGARPTKSKAKEKAASLELHMYRPEELSKFKKREMVADIELLDENLKNSKPDLSVLKEYRKREEEFLNRAKDLDTVTAQRDAQKAKYDGLRKQRLDEFMAGFNLISLKLKEMYQMITLGGNAELELVDSMDPFSEGIIFSVMPPKKSWKNISNLSGGEKTLSSLALVFALHVFKPTPLYFMDEIDAALDFRNVSIVANYIKDRTKNAQFIIISLRNDMFELSHRLIGIYKTANATRSISIDNHALTAVPPPKA
ncbi:putative SMC proteins Flexible Hinge domain containing protein [Lyophyllum shimeji]|uniref:Structural maintenance of chromosomes protein 4 n=1 Tax=Lyophyllum shimeji TaxID=47721 RepID=A0A9P3PYW8_LYOSH|nr:putative SMC proteins Flexible Hinge domain containing protein [Lyophyllum shimeji]